jgi:RNA polymerase sigma factor (sigma-70 family)
VPSDNQLVAGVRAGDDQAFGELYRRYQRRISSFVRRVLHDEGRAEDVTQEAFVSALRRMRATDSEIVFKPWIYEIARNAAIDQWRRSTRAEEVSINETELLPPSDRARLVGNGAPEAWLLQKERIDLLRRALDELSQTHHRIIVMRELEGLSYREIGERLDLSRPAVESRLFRARRRLEREYKEIEAGRRCEAIVQAIARISEGVQSDTDLRKLSRHARRCLSCSRRAREMGVEPLRSRQVAARAAALLPLPGFVARRSPVTPGRPSSGSATHLLSSVIGSTVQVGAAVAERAAALMAAVALAGAGGAVIEATSGSHEGAVAGDQQRGVPAAHHPRVPQTGRPSREGSSGPKLRRQHRVRPGHRGGGTRRGTGRSQTQGARRKAAAATSTSGINAPAAPGVPRLPGLDVAPPEPPAPPDGRPVAAPSTPSAGSPTSAAALQAVVASLQGGLRR